MNLLSWSLAMAFLLLLLIEAMDFHHSLVCRQRAWLGSVELKTRTLLHGPRESEKKFISPCQILVERTKSGIRWHKFNQLNSIPFVLSIKGKL